MDGYHNSPTSTHLVTVCSFNPPGAFYKLPSSSEEVFLCSEVDFESPQRSPKYTDNTKNFTQINPENTTQLILDVYSVQNINGEQKFSNCGWTILPLFNNSRGGIYVNTGNYMVNEY